MLFVQSVSTDERWFRKNKKDNKYYFEVIARNNKFQPIGKSPLYETYKECDKKLIEFIQSIIDESYKIEVVASTEGKKKYYCTFIGTENDILFTATGYNCPSDAKKREKAICETVKRSFGKENG